LSPAQKARELASPALLDTEFAWINKNIARLYVLFSPVPPTRVNGMVVTHELATGLYLIEETYVDPHDEVFVDDDSDDEIRETTEYYLWVSDPKAIGVEVRDLGFFDREKFTI
jgi:hypothetical protein